MTLLETLKKRRSNYDLTAKSTLPVEELELLLAQALELSPTGFNSQSSRIILALGAKHDFFWDIVLAGIKKEIGETPAFEKSKAKISSLRRSAGTILFFEDESITDDLKARFPLYARNFSIWAEQSQGMVQFAVWLALSEAHMGASLQHYSELVATKLTSAWNINPTWRLVAQMPFGIPNSQPSHKDIVPGKQRLQIVK
jgi:hypothetical protein